MKKQRNAALFGGVNTEEILARRLREEGSFVSGFPLLTNDAFTQQCHQVTRLDDDLLSEKLVQQLRSESYGVINIGPDFMSPIVSKLLRDGGIAHIGATPEQLEFETDKSLIRSIFPESSEILPRSFIATDASPETIRKIIKNLNGSFVLKFVGNYSKKYQGSPVGRVRFSGETIGDFDEVSEFARNSIAISGKVIFEEKVAGKEFSSNYIVDRNGNIFRLGENICFKRRNNGNTGPICDGTGSVTIRNTLPFISQNDIEFVENRIVRPFCSQIQKITQQPFCAIINLDLMKDEKGKIVLFEINCREPGGHTMANILSGLGNNLYDTLRAAQNGTLDSITPAFRNQASIVVSAFPYYFPAGISEESLISIEVTKTIPENVKMYTGWVDTLEDAPTYRKLRLRNSPSLLFECSAPTIDAARSQIYEAINAIVRDQLDYRTDIGISI